MHSAVLHLPLLLALGAHEEAQYLVPSTLPPFLLAPALLWHIDVQPQVCCLSRVQVAQLEVSPAHNLLLSIDLDLFAESHGPSANTLPLDRPNAVKYFALKQTWRSLLQEGVYTLHMLNASAIVLSCVAARFVNTFIISQIRRFEAPAIWPSQATGLAAA